MEPIFANTIDPSADESTRFVLPADAPLLANLAALWLADAKLATAIESIDGRPSYPCEASKSGLPTLAIATEGGATLSMHSRYQPIDEAKQLVASVPTGERSAFYVQGFALGYHVEQLFDAAGDEAILLVIEPDLVMLRTAFEQRDYSRLIESGRLLWCWEPDKAALFTQLQPNIALITTGFECVAHAPSVQRSPEFFAQVKTFVGEFEAYARTTINTLVLNSKRTAENIARNLPWYLATPSLSRLAGAYRGKPAIIVSAGPSLRKNKHLLKGADGKAVVIAVQTTLQPLLEMGVEPHFVTSLDYHDICTRFFEKLPANLRTELVAEPKATNKIFDLHTGPLSLLGNDFAESMLSEMQINKTRLPSGATVAHLAYYLAEHLACDPIIFVGQDLGFSDALCYSPGTSYDDVWRPELGRFCTVEMKQWEQIVREKHILRRVPDFEGRPTYTEERLFTYLQHFERDFASSRAKIVDATEGGVRKRGTTPMKLADALAEFCTQPLPKVSRPHPGLRWDLIGPCRTSLLTRIKEIDLIEQISRDTLPLLEEVRDNLHDQKRVNTVISKLDALRARMSGLSVTYNLAMQLAQRTELDKFKADRRISAAKIDGEEKQRRQVQRDIDNVKGVIDATAGFRKMVEEALAVLADFGGRQKGAA